MMEVRGESYFQVNDCTLCCLVIVMAIRHFVKSMYVVAVLWTSLEDEMYSFTSYFVIEAFGLKSATEY